MTNNIFYTATYNLGGVRGFREESYAGIDWSASPTFTEEELNTEIARLQAEYDAQAYARSRALEYPPATDYLDGIVKGDTAQVDKYIADCQAVKDKYPKE